MSTFRKVLFAVLLILMLSVIILTHPSIASIILTMCLFMAVPIFFWQKYLNR